MFKRHSRNKHYWFTIVAANNQVLATSETYITAAMRDKGIEAVKKVVWDAIYGKAAKKAIRKGDVIVGRVRTAPSDTFHIENKEGKIVKR